MWSIAVTVTVGIIIGIFAKWNDKFKKINSNFQIIGLSVLLFFMGVSIGSNPEIVHNLSFIGIKSLAFSVFTVFFSVISIYILTHLLRRNPS
ncbi:MAG: LysO family transporter [Clostridiales bacterium]|nr:LysO family transporter [Clostridiales bacterium]